MVERVIEVRDGGVWRTHGKKGKANTNGESCTTVQRASSFELKSPATKLNWVRAGEGGAGAGGAGAGAAAGGISVSRSTIRHRWEVDDTEKNPPCTKAPPAMRRRAHRAVATYRAHATTQAHRWTHKIRSYLWPLRTQSAEMLMYVQYLATAYSDCVRHISLPPLRSHFPTCMGGR